MAHFLNCSTHRSYWFKPDNNLLSYLCCVAVSAWYAPGNAIIAKIPTHYLPRRYVTWLPKLQGNSKYIFEKKCSKWLHIHKQFLIASCFWNYFTHFTDGKICLGFIGSLSSILVSWHSTVSCLTFMCLQCHFIKSRAPLLTVSRKIMHLQYCLSWNTQASEAGTGSYSSLYWQVLVQMCYERSSFVTCSLTKRQKTSNH